MSLVLRKCVRTRPLSSKAADFDFEPNQRDYSYFLFSSKTANFWRRFKLDKETAQVEPIEQPRTSSVASCCPGGLSAIGTPSRPPAAGMSHPEGCPLLQYL